MKRRFKKRTKVSKATKRALGVKGGFAKLPPFITRPLYQEFGRQTGKYLNPNSLNRFYEKVASNYTFGKTAYARDLIRRFATPVTLEVGKAAVKMAQGVVNGVVQPEGVDTPISISHESMNRYNQKAAVVGKTHKINFTAGESKGKWLSRLTKLTGVAELVNLDTQVNLPLTSSTRSDLTFETGANRKSQILISPDYTCMTLGHLNTMFSLSAKDTNQVKDEIVYGGIPSVKSEITITSLNKYLPTYVKVTLLNPLRLKEVWNNNWFNCVNSNLTSQNNGALPLYYQMDNPEIGREKFRRLEVDPATNGIKSSAAWKTSFDVIATKTVKLDAGDMLKVTYEHLFKSGVRLDTAYALVKDGYPTTMPLTYMMMVEFWGKEVDAYEVGVPANVIKCTLPSVIQFEFKRKYTHVRASTDIADVNTSTNTWTNLNNTAVRVFSNSKLEPFDPAQRRWSDSYINMGINYVVPIMSDTTQQDAGKVT